MLFALFFVIVPDYYAEVSKFLGDFEMKEVAHNVLRHRLILNYEGLAENISTDTIITELLSKVPVP